jgi:hypothetical protein
VVRDGGEYIDEPLQSCRAIGSPASLAPGVEGVSESFPPGC